MQLSLKDSIDMSHWQRFAIFEYLSSPVYLFRPTYRCYVLTLPEIFIKIQIGPLWHWKNTAVQATNGTMRRNRAPQKLLKLLDMHLHVVIVRFQYSENYSILYEISNTCNGQLFDSKQKTLPAQHFFKRSKT